MKQLKDYLHLYLGCECLDFDGTTYQLKPSSLPLNWRNVNLNHKPILRPLSDMTAMEILEIGRISISDFRACYNADQFQKLLSKHFDLFGLIEAGLAIDRTTLTINPNP